MSMGRIEDRIKKMKEAIESEARQRALNIVEKAEEEAYIQSNNIIKQAKQKIDDEFHKLHKAEKVKGKIDKSSIVNRQRILKMQQRYKFVEQLKAELKERLKKIMADQANSKPITQKLIVQGMLRMMERNVAVEALSSQSKMIQSLFPSCQAQFADILKKETGKETQATLTLSEYNLEAKHKAIIGGIFLRSQDGLIVCDNSLDARVELIFEHLLPEIRRMLFPPKAEPVKQAPPKH